jgi:hypothetical protein
MIMDNKLLPCAKKKKTIWKESRWEYESPSSGKRSAVITIYNNRQFFTVNRGGLFIPFNIQFIFNENFHTPWYLKIFSSKVMPFFSMGRRGWGERQFCWQLDHVSFANNCGPDGSGSLRATAQNKSSYLIIFELQHRKVDAWINIETFFFFISKTQRLAHAQQIELQEQ